VTGTLERWFTPAFRKSHPDVMAATALMIEGTSVAGYAGCAAAIRDMNLTGVPEQIRTPTLVLAAADDPSAPPAAMKALHARIAGARFAELADAAHVFTLEKPAETTAILRAFLRETQSAPV
jgi:3-oxoadipate enol-lactonase